MIGMFRKASRSAGRWHLTVALLFPALCQILFIATLFFKGAYLSDFPDSFLQEMLDIPVKTQNDLLFLKIYSFSSLFLTVGCYVETIYIVYSRRYRKVSAKFHFGGIMLGAFLVRLFINIAIRAAYISATMDFIGTEVYSLVLLVGVIVIHRSIQKLDS